jgi:hypothetical protein
MMGDRAAVIFAAPGEINKGCRGAMLTAEPFGSAVFGYAGPCCAIVFKR